MRVSMVHPGDADDPTAHPPIGPEEVRRVARLAHLRLTDEEVVRFTRELGDVLAHMRELEEVDDAGAQPAPHVAADLGPAPSWLRPDEPGASLRRDVVLREAPRVAMAGFAVPAFVEEG